MKTNKLLKILVFVGISLMSSCLKSSFGKPKQVANSLTESNVVTPAIDPPAEENNLEPTLDDDFDPVN